MNSKADIEQLLMEKTKNQIFRTKTKWYEMGEVNSKYFFNLEKHRYNARLCNRIFTEDGRTLKNPQQILKEQENFYRNLYRSNDEVNFDIINTGGIQFPEESTAVMEHPLPNMKLLVLRERME